MKVISIIYCTLIDISMKVISIIYCTLIDVSNTYIVSLVCLTGTGSLLLKGK